MNVAAPETWSIDPAPVGDPDCRAMLHAYLDELISRYYGRPAEKAEIAHEAGDGTDLHGDCGVFLLARADRTPVACAGIRWLSADTGELTRVFVTRSARRGGAGRRLIAAAEDVARARGVTRMVLNTRRDLTEAIALYTRLGYRPTDPYGDDPYAEIWLSKELA
ncbi:GNAT family N-acetyltransferase [Streptomyces sp. NRRL B-24484]|uniref:GNAT family N-acetyltransferase n=1 Tax=Streptomyces sp. NRRL B-24484 TaxID=1463833 RepID=UPI0004BFD204|nr:GNAT family N-acetyltransferase [Streptomyces sp. NRRL B-24484]